MTPGIRLGKVLGVPVVADASAFVLAILFAIVVLIDLQMSRIGTNDTNWLVALIAGCAVLASVLIHEVSHVVVAVRHGLGVRAIRLYLFGGYSVIDGNPSPRSEVAVAAAGPIASLVFGGVCWSMAMWAGADSVIGSAIFAVALANIGIGLFNLLPGFPLDGGRVLRGLIASRTGDRVGATQVVAAVGRWIGYAAVGAGAVMIARRSSVGLFVLAAGWYLAATAGRAGRREQLSAALDGLLVRDAMRETPNAVPGRTTVASMLDLHALGPRLRSLPVEIDGRVVGVIGQDEIDAVAPSRWPSVRVRSVMTDIGPDDVVEADAPLEALLVRPAGRTRRVVVTTDDVVVGIIEGSDLAKVLPDGAARA
ncbi:MAG TPA: M50 family metallopeptidase [Acidimicrobiia bacterium]|nr:M50 family metallopeptidase [Acidimicrobiia bacterium]